MSSNFSHVRREYLHATLDEKDILDDPIAQFKKWLGQAEETGIDLPNAMVLATASTDGIPTARYVLLKEVSEAGFVFYTHSVSVKGHQLRENPHAALVFYWSPMDRQVRIEGQVEVVDGEDADQYFASRPFEARVNTLVAPQSSVVQGREYLEERSRVLQDEYQDKHVPRPKDWRGYCVIPRKIEFWQGREDRLHDRILFSRKEDESWIMQRLAP